MNPIQTKFSKYKAVIIMGLLPLVVFLTYANALGNGLLATWDTQGYVISNTHIRELNWETVGWMLTTFEMSNWHPLTWLSHAIDYAVFGLEPPGHHLVSVIFHALNTMLLFVVSVALLSYCSPGTGHSTLTNADNFTLLAGAFTALLFAVHPQHVESVVWIAERKDVLCLFFTLLSLLFYLYYSSARSNRSGRQWYLSALLCFVLALMAKPMALTLPVVFLLLDIYPLKKTDLIKPASSPVIPWSRLLTEKLPFLLFMALSAVITVLAQQEGGSLANLEGQGIHIRMLNAFNSLMFYLSKFMLPIGLSPFYPYPEYSSFQQYLPSLIPVVAVLLITVLCGYAWYRKKYFWLVAWVFYLVTISPVIGVVQVGSQAAADRYTYFPTLPFYLLVGIALAQVFYSEKARKLSRLATATALSIAIVTLIQLTRNQTEIWKDDVTFWSYVVSKSPDNGFARFKLGDALMTSNEIEPAVNSYRNAMFLDPERLWYGIHLPAAYMRLARYPDALETLNLLLDNHVARNNREDRLYTMRAEIYFRYGQFQIAGENIDEALRLNPENIAAKRLARDIDSNMEQNQP
jgi:hypothetical protein